MKNIEKLQYITQSHASFTHAELVKKAYISGCRWVQLRIKDMTETALIEQAMQAVEWAKKYNGTLIINDHPEIAKKTGAHGVHLGKNDISPLEARKLLGSRAIIGSTANNFEDIKELVDKGVDYIGLGPYRFTTTKKNLSPIIGIEGYQSIAKKMKENKIRIPIVAIGGILLQDVEELLQIGFGIAVSAAVTHSDMEKDCNAFVKKIYIQ